MVMYHVILVRSTYPCQHKGKVVPAVPVEGPDMASGETPVYREILRLIGQAGV